MTTIKELRKQNGLTQREVADKLGLGLSTYQQKEQGVINWLLRDLVLLRRIFKVDLDDLIEIKQIEENALKGLKHLKL